MSALPNAIELEWGSPNRKSATSYPVALPEKLNAPRASCCERMLHRWRRHVAAERDVVTSARGEDLGAASVCRVAVRGSLCAAEAGDAAREQQPRRTPVDRILIVANDARVARHVGAVREVRCDVAGQCVN